MVEGSRQVVLVVHNIRSAHNVGSLLRTADGLGIEEVIFSGYTPYPRAVQDDRLPHVVQRATNQIRKTALLAEKSVAWHHTDDIDVLLDEFRTNGYLIAALEQADGSVALSDFNPPAKTVLILGNEVDGVDKKLLKRTDVILEIPMRGRKESFNVAAAAAMALYHLTLLDR